jgi:hypothetical protein
MYGVCHILDDDLEQYALNRLPDSAAGKVEEHLLICEDCRRRLDETDQLIRGN